MGVDVRPAEQADIDGVVDLLYGHMSSKITRERWRSLLDYPWRPEGTGRGHVAVDGDRVVGYLGLVCVDRPIGGRVERFGNICAWYLLKDYRGRGVGQELQYATIADKELTYTLVTPTAGTDRAFRCSGFLVLDEERYLLRRRSEGSLNLQVLEGPDAVAPMLASAERVILDHHRHFNLRHLFLSAGGQGCYLVVQARKQGEDVNYHQAMYLSDPGFVATHGQAIADAILEPGRAVFSVDRRFMPDAMPWEIDRIGRPRLYSSPRVAPSAIDHLYNEVVLLDLKLP